MLDRQVAAQLSDLREGPTRMPNRIALKIVSVVVYVVSALSYT